MVWFCFEDIFFVLFVRIEHETSFTLDNFIGFIRDYFILEYGTYHFGRYRDPTKFNDIQKRVIDIYPILKEKYGMNRILEKLNSYFEYDNDYNKEKVKKILDNYYNKKYNNLIDDETINLKDKQD